MIKRQVVELEFPKGGDESHLSRSMSDVFRRRLLPMMAEVFDELSPPNTLHHLDRLEINLGELRLSQLETDLELQFRRAFRSGFEQAIQGVPSHQKQDRASAWEILRHFLHTGLLPWWADAQNSALLEDAVRQLPKENSPRAVAQELSLLLRGGNSRQRLWANFSDESLLILLRMLMSNWNKELEAQILDWLDFIKAQQKFFQKPSRLLRNQSWEIVFLLALESSLDTATLQQIQQQLTEKRDWHPGQAVKTMEQYLKQLINRTGKSPIDKKTLKKGEESIYLNNAGLVLLTPFLSPFFEQFGWTKDNVFVSAQEQQRAALALQYLVDGSSSAPEFLLPLNKLLCGLDLAMPLQDQDPLSEPEQSASDELLEAIIAHAPHLGITTIDGLRGSFLLREGILRHKGKNWELHVQRETYDIVLDRLPWAFQVVKLPWMAEPIFVVW